VRAAQDKDIDFSDSPELTSDFFQDATLSVNGVEVPRKKKRITIMLDPKLIDRFKHDAKGRGYQTMIGEVLKEHFRQRDLLSRIRQVVREEVTTLSHAHHR